MRKVANKLQSSPNSMAKFRSSIIFFPLHLFALLHLLQFSSLSLQSSAYTLPDKYFINCGSNSNVTGNGRNFIGDENSGFYAGQSSSVEDTNSSTATTSLYKTARVFTKPSSYKFQIVQNGTHMVRLHFYPFSSPKNLFNARFDVSATGFSLLSNFSAQINSANSPQIKEFLMTIEAGKFTIDFKLSPESSFAFVNAIEVFLVPDNFIPDHAILVTSSGGNSTNYNDLLSRALRVVYRINVGGAILTEDNDTLWRNWVPDDEYLLVKDAAKNSEFYSDRPEYQRIGTTEYIAPDLVYQTAKEMNIDPERGSNFFNISWRFSVSKNAPHFVRFHFCDIISPALNVLKFNLYLYSNFSEAINPYEIISQLAAPFYTDFMVDSDNSGFMNISVGPREDSFNQTAFVNGLEIMELVGGADDNKSIKKNRFLIVSLVVGGVVFLFVLVGLFSWVLKSRKAKPAESSDWQSIHIFRVGSSNSRTTERTGNSSPAHNLNLGLRLSFVDIQHATNNFDPKLMIGEGGFGKVYKGTLRDGTKVAVKRSEPGHGQGLPEFQTEIMVLSRIRHRHLVSLIGYCDEWSEMVLVYEFMEKGTLRDHLYNWSGNSDKSSTSRSQLSWIQRLEICIGAAKGLHYLHTSSDRSIIHRDVKSTNILLDKDYVAKVADFGLSRLGALDQTHVSTEVKGSFGYLDPEYFKWLQLTQKSDVYSFGVVLLEVLCARQVINSSLPREQVNLADWGLSWQKKGQLEKIVDPLLAGKINPNSLRMFGEIVDKCLKESGSERPSMHDVLWDLEYALQLQQIVRHREPHEDSTTDSSSLLPVPVVHRLPSDSMPIDGYDIPMADISGASYSNVKDVFSQLRMDDAR